MFQSQTFWRQAAVNKHGWPSIRWCLCPGFFIALAANESNTGKSSHNCLFWLFTCVSKVNLRIEHVLIGDRNWSSFCDTHSKKNRHHFSAQVAIFRNIFFLFSTICSWFLARPSNLSFPVYMESNTIYDHIISVFLLCYLSILFFCIIVATVFDYFVRRLRPWKSW